MERNWIMSQLTLSPSPGGATVSGVLVNVGRKLGLYQAMAGLGAGTSIALSA
jgi:hypothetical protein